MCQVVRIVGVFPIGFDIPDEQGRFDVEKIEPGAEIAMLDLSPAMLSHALDVPGTHVVGNVLALPFPVLTGYAGWLLVRPPEASEFATSVGNGLVTASIIVFAFRFLQLLCLPRGLLRAHFDWSERACRMLIRNLGRLMLVAVPASFLIGMIEVSKSQTYRDGLGRLTFLICAIALAVFTFRVLSPRRGMFAARLSREGALWMTRGAWYFLLGAAPLALAALAMSGYYDSASDLQWRLGWI